MKNVEDITHFPPETGTQEGGRGWIYDKVCHSCKERQTQRSSKSMIMLYLFHIMTSHDVVTFCNVKLL